MEVKEPRVLATSVLLDSGSSLTEAALLLRHSDKLTTERLYANAMLGHAHYRARREVHVDQGASIGERLDALWLAWVAVFPVVSAQLGMGGVNQVAVDVRHRPS